MPVHRKFLAICSANVQVYNLPRQHWHSWYVVLSCNHCSILLTYMFRSEWFSGVLFFNIQHGSPPLLEAATLWSLVDAWMEGLSANDLHDFLCGKLSSPEEEQRGRTSIMHLIVETSLWTYLLCDDRHRPNGWLAPAGPCSQCKEPSWHIAYPKPHVLHHLLRSGNPPQVKDYNTSPRAQDHDFEERSHDSTSLAAWKCRCGQLVLAPLRAPRKDRRIPRMLSEFRLSNVVEKAGRFKIFMGRGKWMRAVVWLHFDCMLCLVT